MFTRCANCRTVFHITAAELRAADGTVICGACGVTFDALDSLSETRPKDPPYIEAERREAVAPAPVGESPVEIDEQARDEDEFLQELESLIGGEIFLEEPAPAEEPTGTGFPQMDFSRAPLRDEELAAGLSTADEAHDEFADEDEFLVEDFDAEIATEESRFDQSLIVDELSEPGDDESGPQDPLLEALEDDDELDDPFLDPDSVFRIDEELEDGAGGIESGKAAAGAAGERRDDPVFDAEDANDVEAGGIFAWRDARRAPADLPPEGGGNLAAEPGESGSPDPVTADQAEAAPGPVADAGADAEAVTDGSTEPLPEFARQYRPGRRWLRVTTALIAVMLLTGTWAHSQRGKLLRHPAGEALLGPVYGVLGMEVAPDWNPAEYRAVQWQAIADGDRPDDLAVAVDFMNMAAYAQPYPVIRIVLEDRFGRRVGIHDVPPSIYLRDHSRGSRMAGGGRLQTTVVVRDPGGRADGFRVDFCLELEGRGLVCGPEPFR